MSNFPHYLSFNIDVICTEIKKFRDIFILTIAGFPKIDCKYLYCPIKRFEVKIRDHRKCLFLCRSSVGSIELEVIASDDVQDTKNKARDVSTFSLAESVLLQCSEMRMGSDINAHEIKGQIVEAIESSLLTWKKNNVGDQFLKG